MTERDDIDPAQAIQITERIGQTFEFVWDAIDDPRLLEQIPNGSTLMFRDTTHRGTRIRLVAYRPQLPAARWGAHVSGAATAPMPGSPSSIERRTLARRTEQWPSVEDYETASAALDALEAKLRTTERPRWASRRAVG